MISSQAEEYLEYLYKVTDYGKPARTTQIARDLKISPASVTEMVKKLAHRGYLNYEPYRGVTLTKKGRTLGRRMTRRHRLLEKFFHDVLGMKKEKVHDEACRMEHTLSSDTEEAICRLLDGPGKCSDDGQSIPPCEKDVFTCDECEEVVATEPEGRSELVPLNALSPGEKANVRFIRAGRGLSRRLGEMGLTQDTEVVVSSSALNGPLIVEVKGSRLVLGRGVAGKIFVKAT